MIDTHCHIDLYPDPHKVLREAERDGVTTIAVTNLPSHFEMGRPHVRAAKRVRLALGLHPLLAERHTQDELRKFKQLLSETSYVGEIGLDYSRHGKATANKQLQSFRFALEAIRDQPYFTTLHSRGAEEEVLGLLGEFRVKAAIFHWYSGPLTLVDSIVSAGHYLSFNPAMARSAKGRKIIDRVPREQVLTETDGPHLQVDSRPARPSDVRVVVGYLASAWGESQEAVEHTIRSNLNRILLPVRQHQGSE